MIDPSFVFLDTLPHYSLIFSQITMLYTILNMWIDFKAFSLDFQLVPDIYKQISNYIYSKEKFIVVQHRDLTGGHLTTR